MIHPEPVPQLVSSTIVPGRYRRAAGTVAPSGPRRKPPASRSSMLPKTLGAAAPREAPPFDRATGGDQSHRLAVRQERVLGDRWKRALAGAVVGRRLAHRFGRRRDGRRVGLVVCGVFAPARSIPVPNRMSSPGGGFAPARLGRSAAHAAENRERTPGSLLVHSPEVALHRNLAAGRSLSLEASRPLRGAGLLWL